MKSSQKILIVFFSIIALFHLSLLFEVDKPDFYETHSAKEFRPKPFSHLMINDDAVLMIEKDTTQNQLKYHYLKNTQPDTSFFFVRNDTLFVKNPHLKGKSKAITLKYKKLNSITANNSHINLLNNPDKNTVIKSRAGEIRIRKKDSLQNLNISLSQESRLKVEAKYLKTANIDMTNSSAHFNTSIENLNADIRKNSNLSVKNVIHSNIRNDGSSYFSNKQGHFKAKD
ncbi:hypothetical protein [Marinilabilia rubra]|uniref:Uncharacterized protein n=1 Tax=Marinilabilia rubra TaxID=2162893 RepID=A0A2U2BBK3_9BACT|nr:hypothetical protein [Marinilabilia rubra]PWE00438.1 hypothetical protein DDZ16_05780 [Marinilabilia rubra]